MLQIAIGLIRLQEWFHGDFRKVIGLVEIADEIGIDLVTMTDHLAFSKNVNAYPHGKFNFALHTPFYEPISSLSAIAARTSRIRLSTGILLGPLRPTLLLAKQLATLDAISGGRVEIGLGAGWQKEEFDACNIAFEGRFGLLMEQADALRVLWRDAPASFHGKHVNFDDLYCLPFPTGEQGIPILFGLAATDRNFERIAKHGDGWIPIENDATRLEGMVARLHAAFEARGRDPRQAVVRVMAAGTTSVALEKIAQDGPLNLDEIAQKIPALMEAGVNQLEFHPFVWMDGPGQFPIFMERLVSLKQQFS